MTPAPGDDLVERLRAIGCVFAEEEAAEVRRIRGAGRHDDVVAARGAGMPLEQVLGVARFAGVDVALADGVFVPRTRAAVLVEVAATIAGSAQIVVDLGCGSGAIAAALTRRLPGAEVHAADVDACAVAVARRNGAVFGFAVHQGSWWDALPPSLVGSVDVAVAYLPHVPSAAVAHIPRDFREHEPRGTVDGGQDGLDALREVLAGGRRWLQPDGALVTLVAAEQVEAASGLDAGWRADVVVAAEPEDEDDTVLVFRPIPLTPDAARPARPR